MLAGMSGQSVSAGIDDGLSVSVAAGARQVQFSQTPPGQAVQSATQSESHVTSSHSPTVQTSFVQGLPSSQAGSHAQT